jgi:hypothetical protein
MKKNASWLQDCTTKVAGNDFAGYHDTRNSLLIAGQSGRLRPIVPGFEFGPMVRAASAEPC